MNPEIKAMCAGCKNCTEAYKCKLAWISTADQKERAKVGYCGDAKYSGNQNATESAVKVGEVWFKSTEV